MSSELPYIPEPPNAQNTMTQRPRGDLAAGRGLTLSPETVISFARLYNQYRPIIGWGAKLAKQKIPKELDDAMRVVAATGDPDALRKLQEEQAQEDQAVNMQPNAQGQYEMPQDTPGAPVMTDDMAEEAYYLHHVKHLGTLQIAEYFTSKGSPVSKATVARYIDDKAEQYEEEEEEGKRALKRRLGLVGVGAVLWFVSAVGLHHLLDFLHFL
jgi:hypothetical protein